MLAIPRAGPAQSSAIDSSADQFQARNLRAQVLYDRLLKHEANTGAGRPRIKRPSEVGILPPQAADLSRQHFARRLSAA
jgi:hypothetical protein